MEKKIADILSMWNQGIVDSKKAGEMFENLLEENDYPSAVGIAIAKMREC